MTPQLRERVQTIGGLLVTLCLGMYVWQGVPFLMADPASSEIPTGEGRVTAKQVESLSGATNETAVSFRIEFSSTTSSGEMRRGRGEVSQEFFESAEVEDPVEVIFWGGRCLLKDDLRWQPQRHRRYWFMLAATAAFGLVTLRRVVMRGKQ